MIPRGTVPLKGNKEVSLNFLVLQGPGCGGNYPHIQSPHGIKLSDVGLNVSPQYSNARMLIPTTVPMTIIVISGRPNIQVNK